METYTVKNAQNSLNQLLSDAHKGKTAVITAENGWAVKLVPTPIRAKKPRKAGSARGQVWMSDDFDDPWKTSPTIWNEFGILHITAEHAEAVAKLSFPESGHRDPFDRMIIAQAICHDLTIVARDAAFSDYSIQRIC